MHVLGIVIRVVEVDDALLMCLDDVLGQEDAVGQVAADLARHVVTLGRVDDRVLVGVFLIHFFINMVQKCQDAVIGRVGLAF